MSFEPGLTHGQVLNNTELSDLFHCGTQGGMRRGRETNTLVLISDSTKGIYDDRWEGNTLHYTGMGREGDQILLFSQNRTLFESEQIGIDVFLFEVFEARKYVFQGKVRLAGNPYSERQLDVNNNDREVWVFPIELISSEGPIPISEALFSERQEELESEARRLSTDELERRARAATRQPGSRAVLTKQRQRNPYVAVYAKIRANGRCQLCGNDAPFGNINGDPYLETHHIEWLSEGGEDSIGNTVALCPNCHRKMHILNLSSDRRILYRAIV